MTRPFDDRGGAEGQEPDERAHLEALARAVGQAEDVVEEAVLVVPHLVGVVADRVDGGRDPEEVLDELQHEVLGRVVVLCEGQRQLEHVLAEDRHPGRAVGLLQAPARRQRRTAVEHPDVVEAEEPTLEHVAAGGVLAVHPPREVEQQLREALAEERDVDRRPAPSPGCRGTGWRRRAPGGSRRRSSTRRPASGRSGGGRPATASGRPGSWRSRGRPWPAGCSGRPGPRPRTTGTPTCRASR